MTNSQKPASLSASDAQVELGRVSGPYGVRGWIKIDPHSSQADVLLGAATWWLGRGEGGADAQPVTVLQSRRQGASIVAQLEGLDDRDQAMLWRGSRVWVPRSAFPALPDDEFYWVDLVGCVVHGVDAEDAPAILGVVREVSDNGAHGVLHVERMQSVDGALVPWRDDKGRGHTELVPFVAAFVEEVDLAARLIRTGWPLDV